MALQRLVTKQQLTSTIWNATMDEIEANQAAVGAGSLSWPLEVQGDINMGQQFEIVGLQSFWNIINVHEYGDDLDAAITAAETVGGTCVFIPPYTTATATNAVIGTSGIVIMGAGPTSVLKLTSGAGPVLDTVGTSALTGIGVFNLTIDQSAGTAAIGIRMRRVARLGMGNLYFTGGTGPNLVLTNGGTAGQSCTNVFLREIHFAGGTGTGAYHLQCIDVDGLIVQGLYSESCPATSGAAVYMDPASDTSALMRDITLTNVHVNSPAGKGVSILGAQAGADDKWSRVRLTGVRVDSPTSTGIEVGATAKIIKSISVNADVYNLPAAVACLSVNASGGVIQGCDARGGAPGLDLVSSIDLYVTGNNFRDATTYGIDADAATECTIEANDVRDCTTLGIKRPTTDNGNVIARNPGDYSTYVSDPQLEVVSSGAATEFGLNYSIPAGAVQVGDSIRVTGTIRRENTNNTATASVKVGGTAISNMSLGASANIHLTAVIYIAALTGQNTHVTQLGLSDAVSVYGSDNSPAGYLTVDWTSVTPVEIDFTITPNTDTDDRFYLCNVQIEFLRRSEV
jgi:hypothetical protein